MSLYNLVGQEPKLPLAPKLRACFEWLGSRFAQGNKTSVRSARTGMCQSMHNTSMPSMRSRCYLVSCVGAKHSAPSKAKNLYTSDWFKKARLFVERSGCPWFILSAEHGLVDPESIIVPYEKTLNHMGVRERRAWAAKVVSQMNKLLPQTDSIVVLAGARYREFLMDYLRSRAREVVLPLEGLRIGEQLSWLASHSREEHAH